MKESRPKDLHISQALDLASQAIELDARGEHADARLSWQQASDQADEHLVGEDIYYWIKSGLGAILYDVGDFRRAIEVSDLALEWCLKIGQPLPSLTIAKAYLKLGEGEKAAKYVAQAHRLIGDDVFEQLDPDDRDLMRDRLRRPA
ncbi:MAG: hypothetical protein AB7F09_05135 [Parvibaculaceae bacterium]